MTRTAAKRLERFFWTVGFLALGTFALVWFQARNHQAQGSRELDRRRVTHLSSTERAPSQGSLIGRLEIPSVGLSAIVFEGSDTQTLAQGIGHLAGSPLPGEAGNVVLAGHRDTFFRNLRKIHQSDVILLTTERATRRYAVESTAVVSPYETEVLNSANHATLTLITCFPFYYIGPAPKRFIVRAAELTGEAPAQAPAVPVQRAAAPLHKPRVSTKKPVPSTKLAALVQDEPPVPASQSQPEAHVTATDTIALAPSSEPETAETEAVLVKAHSRRGIKKLNPVPLFGKLAHIIRNSDN